MISKKSFLELIGFSDADHAGSKTDRKSTSGTCQFLGHMLVAQIYVDDIIFGTTNQSLCEHFAKEMQSEFEMSMMEN